LTLFFPLEHFLMSSQNTSQDPLDFVRTMWGNMGFSLPGMVAPTLDIDELDKRISDLKTVENWLKMNLNMLQMTTQGLEMQRAALAAMQAMGEHARSSGTHATPEPDSAGMANPFASTSALWPWNLMATAANLDPSASSGSGSASNNPAPAQTDKPRETRRASSSGPNKKGP
jgi:hypothetical protein